MCMVRIIYERPGRMPMMSEDVQMEDISENIEMNDDSACRGEMARL